MIRSRPHRTDPDRTADHAGQPHSLSKPSSRATLLAIPTSSSPPSPSSGSACSMAQMEYIFGNITGAIRLEDGSVVVADESIFEVRMYDADGRHVWTRGRKGEGPGEYKGLRLLRGCPGAAITVFDWYLDRITELGLDGSVADTRTLAAAGVNPYQDLACSPGGDLVFQPWPKVILDRTVAAGEHYRWEMVLNRVGDEGVVTLRSGIPGAERTNLSAGSRPRMWGRKMVFAVAPTGVWFGSGDDYELEHVDWLGKVTRVTRWAGPDLEVTREHLGQVPERPVGQIRRTCGAPALRKGRLARYTRRVARAFSGVRCARPATGRQRVGCAASMDVAERTAPAGPGRRVASSADHPGWIDGPRRGCGLGIAASARGA